MIQVSETIRRKKIDAARGDRGMNPTYALAAVLLAGGFLAPLAGIVFFVVHSIFSGDEFFSRLGSALVFVSIPLLLAGSHFLDRFDAREKARRAAAADEPES